MDRFLASPPDERARYCLEVAARRGIPAVAVEKDFWVCWTLRELMTLPQHGEHLIFKGGTSLSKGWKVIERFSEDIDLVVDRAHLGFTEEEPSRGQIKKLRRRCQSWIADTLRPALDKRIGERLRRVEAWRLDLAAELDDPDRETLVFEYPGLDLPGAGYIRASVRIELGARSETEPTEQPVVTTYLSEELPEHFGSDGVPIRTLAARRTLLEKVMLLHEEHQRPPERPMPPRLSRHYYDLWCLSRSAVGAEAVADGQLFARIASHRERFWAQSWVDYSTLRLGRIRLAPPDGRISSWRVDYAAMREMIFGAVPPFEEILAEVSRLEAALNSIAAPEPSR